MNIIRYAFESLVNVAILSFFFLSTYYRIKTIRVRFKMKEAKEIATKNLSLEALFSFCFWFIPLRKYREIGNQFHNRYAKKCNVFLFLLIVSVAIYFYA